MKITLTDKQPVDIHISEWPIIAQAKEGRILVRQRDDGTTIVHAPGHGELVRPGDDIAEAIIRTAIRIGKPELAQLCISRLPAIQL